MPRTVINLDPENKEWLDEEARGRYVPMIKLVRQAVDAYRIRESSKRHPNLQNALDNTKGIWNNGDELDHQKRLRAEWD